MSSIKKMVLVDPTQLQQTPQRPVTDALGSAISSLDQHIHNILANSTMDEYTKAQQYNQALQRYLTLSDKYRERPLGKVEMKVSTPDLPTPELPTTENQTRLKPTLYQTLPPTLRSKGAALLNHLESIPGIKWDNKQQLVVDDKPIPKSNVVDLIDDLVRDRKTTKPPPGWSELATVLKQVNTPRALIGNSRRRLDLTQDRPSRRDSNKKPTIRYVEK